MPRRCTVCADPRRAEVDRLIAAGTAPLRRIATDHGFSESAVRRHAEDHVPAAMAEAAEAELVAHGASLLDQVTSLHRRALGLLQRAEVAGDFRAAMAGIREARGCIELLARLEGQLRDREAATVNVLVAPDYLRLRGAILGALAEHPEAAQKVASALAGAEVG
ncbi:MAG: hypothetical protein WCH83_06675 [Alphaproteobacteria bacterium]